MSDNVMQENVTPPVPPPPPLQTPKVPNLDRSETSTRPITTTFHEAVWASNDPDLQRACFFGRVCLHHPPKKYKYHEDIKTILQNGPTCGLTAISMLLQGNVTADELLVKAKNKGYTNNGEMFSTENLLSLLINELPFNFEAELWVGPLECDEIKKRLISGSVLFVPYDSDVNHAPTQLKGHKAHWALVIGYLVDQDDEFYILARHGKSRYLAAWSLTELSKSNMGLEEFAQPKEHPDDVFLLPDGGIAGKRGLKGRSIIVMIR